MHIPFSASPRTSLGIEWELELVDLQTRQLRGAATEILEEFAAKVGDQDAAKAKHELFESTIEVITGVCDSVPQALADLTGTIDVLRGLAERRGIGLMCSGTHPISEYNAQAVSVNDRYYRLVDNMQWLARRLLIFGVHVHVGVRSKDKAFPIVNALMSFIPHFLALSASSPYWLGRDTGLASSRSKIFESLPTAGLPYQLTDWPQFERFMETLVTSGTIESIREVWWDIRPHPNFGTVELRICDGLPTLQEVGAVAALAQCLVDQMNTQLDRGYTLPVPRRWVVQENKWRAARYGLDAEILVDERGNTRPVRAELADLVDDLLPVAHRLGCAAELSDIPAIMNAGASYERQRSVARRAGGDLSHVVDTLLEEMNTGRLV
ncbi:glutamate--cysteine ligase [Frankia sp. CNm7]|uniref:Putative glutamate--cysteine ligase 2 n=1 Tax=Frankia nepalensis TaxID=1836974 RepID=A0A937UVW8_9ACTN|nr:glutamate--cysteine ligase [Frankia nepalensis]MBL7501720.1 glutamate--cysteine ligase [Frankia nepalensis]MBL7514246.1 glutamate--cysteine ligase [Frankia nepalensis]MBL7524820.1 glutamate--cysteine ligase [Frankia nepalensis]MBL7633645.1 glutamate--cysteine ligase [Frankia nepalensis]